MLNEYINAIGGGLLIGSASLFLFLGIGRIAGVSGIFWRCLSNNNERASERFWPMVFVAGLCFGGWLLHVITNIPMPELTTENRWQIAVSGLLVGFGTRLGNGCTSGHGVCGIGRLSLRSMIATSVFMITAVFTVILTRHFVY